MTESIAPTAPAQRRASPSEPLAKRFFTAPGADVMDRVQWNRRDAAVNSADGSTLFLQRDVEAPVAWSDLAVRIAASKYFHGLLDTSERETSVRQLVERVAHTIRDWGLRRQYFEYDEAVAFGDELKYILVHQMAAFNSPVWFNVGVQSEKRGGGYATYGSGAVEGEVRKVPDAGEPRPQCSACFILSVNDTLESILELAKTEGMLFKWGSGSGTNLSTLREAGAALGGGGRASGPLSFMKGFDAFAGVIKSGGKTRRAAKMVVLNVSHPDVRAFVNCKREEEAKAHALVAAGYDPSMEGPAYSSIFYQNANNSVRVPDAFMRAAEHGEYWILRSPKTGEPVGDPLPAKKLLREMAEAAWACGDPGMQFDDAANVWHTCPNSGRINASNPCSEYMFLDDSACNLASINLARFIRADYSVDFEALLHVVRVLILAQEIIVDLSSYPTEAVARKSRDYRPLGLGYANLGSLLMRLGLPYDSEAGRALAAGITSAITGAAYEMSAWIAAAVGCFDGYAPNEKPFLAVMEKHREATRDEFYRRGVNREPGSVAHAAFIAAESAWSGAIALGTKHGFRNAQATVIAPTGTIGFLMDCDTTGIEPELALVKYKNLAGGGMLTLANEAVSPALWRLGYDQGQIKAALEHVQNTGSLETWDGFFDEEHRSVFDTSFGERRPISWRGHLLMMAAVQPFVSGAISKTINMPNSATVEDVERAYREAWKLGLKAVAIYRDGSKAAQPLTTKKAETVDLGKLDLRIGPIDLGPLPVFTENLRRKLPDERRAVTHKFSIAGHEGYVTVGLFDDGSPGEVFVRMSKQGSTVGGLVDAFATLMSYTMQYGVPLRFIVEKFKHTRFEPAGITENPQIRFASSIVDYLARWLELRFLQVESSDSTTAGEGAAPPPAVPSFGDAPMCPNCGNVTVRNGSCHKCPNCGTTTGCS